MSLEEPTPFGPDLWTLDGDPLRMLGIPFRTRMTVVRLPDGGLWLHSPVAPTPERLSAVAKLGPVRHLVAPCTFHHLHVATWSAAHPDATIWGVPGLRERYPERRFDETLSDEPPSQWSGTLDQVVFRGSKVMVEVVFFHRPSKALLITDIVQNHEPELDGLFWRTVKRLNNIAAPNGGAPRDWRLSVRDRTAARECRDRMLAWPFDKVVLTHGRCLTEDAHAHIERAFDWLG